jgi:hypothetical protein
MAGQRQQWPTRSVKLVVPFAAGGTTDILARVVAVKISEEFGVCEEIQEVVGGWTNRLRARPCSSKFPSASQAWIVARREGHPAARIECHAWSQRCPLMNAEPRQMPSGVKP